jgi:hypothetical protein
MAVSYRGLRTQNTVTHSLVQSQIQSHIATDGQMGLMAKYLLLFDSYGLVLVGRPINREDE